MTSTRRRCRGHRETRGTGIFRVDAVFPPTTRRERRRLTDPPLVSKRFPYRQMLKGGVIMDVVNVEQARIAEEAGAVAVMAPSAAKGGHPQGRRRGASCRTPP